MTMWQPVYGNALTMNVAGNHEIEPLQGQNEATLFSAYDQPSAFGWSSVHQNIAYQASDGDCK